MEKATRSRLQNKVAVITGGTSGIGLAVAQRFLAEGHRPEEIAAAMFLAPEDSSFVAGSQLLVDGGRCSV